MKRSIILLVSVILILAARFEARADFVVTLKSEVSVRPGAAVRVRDIATLKGVLSASKKIADVVVGTGPVAGARRTIEIDYVRLRISAVCAKGVRVVGPSEVNLTGRSRRLSSEALSEKARALVESLLPVTGASYEVTVERQSRALTVPDGEVEVGARLLGSIPRPGVNNVALDVTVDGRPAATTSVTVRVKLVADVLVTTAAVRQGEPLGSQNTTWEKREVSRGNAVIVMPTGGDPGEMLARRLISAGQVVAASDVETPCAVKKGDAVTVTVTCGGVTLRTTGEARQDARIGDSLSVKTSISGQDVRARVIAPGSVHIAR